MRPSHLLLAFAAALAFASPVLAADYNPPIFVDEAPEYRPVEVGNGWYLRGDVTYNVNEPVYDFTLFGEDTDNTRFGVSGGFGYHINDFLRTELNVGWIGRDKYEYNDGVDLLSGTFSAWTGMVNGYVDLGTVSGFTPYVGGGIGVMSAKHEITADSPTFAGDWSDRQYELAYSLAAGVNYRLGKNTSIDVGYEYLSSPNTTYLDTDTLTIDEGVDFHRIKVGLRYELW